MLLHCTIAQVWLVVRKLYFHCCKFCPYTTYYTSPDKFNKARNGNIKKNPVLFYETIIARSWLIKIATLFRLSDAQWLVYLSALILLASLLWTANLAIGSYFRGLLYCLKDSRSRAYSFICFVCSLYHTFSIASCWLSLLCQICQGCKNFAIIRVYRILIICYYNFVSV